MTQQLQTAAGTVITMNDDNDEQQLSECDVLCGRDKRAFNHPGNRQFRVTISQHQDAYSASSSRKAKSIIIQTVVAAIRRRGGRFVRAKNDASAGVVCFTELSAKETHEKVAHAFRDMVLSTKKTTAVTAQQQQQQQHASKRKQHASPTVAPLRPEEAVDGEAQVVLELMRLRNSAALLGGGSVEPRLEDRRRTVDQDDDHDIEDTLDAAMLHWLGERKNDDHLCFYHKQQRRLSAIHRLTMHNTETWPLAPA